MIDSNLFIGLLSGTSLDAVDAAVVDFSLDAPKLIAYHQESYPTELYRQLKQLIREPQIPLASLGDLDVWVGEVFSNAVHQLLAKSQLAAQSIQAIGSHGQNICHSPNTKRPHTLQIGDPNVIAANTNITTIADFRRKDVALGGQGAPLAPAFHAQFMQTSVQDRVVLNIGGIANVTLLKCDASQAIIGFDTGPGNCLLDDWVHSHQQKKYDMDGQWGASGQVSETLLTALLSDPYFEQALPKSTGREYFNLTWLNQRVGAYLAKNKPADVQATLAELTAISIASAVSHHHFQKAEIIVCGGGLHNVHLLQRLRHQLPQATIQSSMALGIHPDWVEAMTFAWFAKQALAGQPSNLPSVTGARKSCILGGIYPQTL